MIEDNDTKYFTFQSNIVFALIPWYLFEIINNYLHLSLEQMEMRQSVVNLPNATSECSFLFRHPCMQALMTAVSSLPSNNHYS